MLWTLGQIHCVHPNSCWSIKSKSTSSFFMGQDGSLRLAAQTCWETLAKTPGIMEKTRKNARDNEENQGILIFNMNTKTIVGLSQSLCEEWIHLSKKFRNSRKTAGKGYKHSLLEANEMDCTGNSNYECSWSPDLCQTGLEVKIISRSDVLVLLEREESPWHWAMGTARSWWKRLEAKIFGMWCSQHPLESTK